MKDRSYYAALSQSPRLMKRQLIEVARAELAGDHAGRGRAVQAFCSTMRRTMALADVLGRKRVVDAVSRHAAKIADADQKYSVMFDSVVAARFSTAGEVMESPDEGMFNEAIEALLSREPVLARSREAIAQAYGLGQKFAVQKLPDALGNKAAANITVKLWETVADLGVKGASPTEARRVLAKVADIAESYAETIYRTNLASAYTAGRFKQMEDPDVREVTPAFEYSAVGDISTRQNHAAADGAIAGTGDSLWDRVCPPMGFNCRCDLRVVTRFELEDRGLLDARGNVIKHTPPGFARAHPDKGFTLTRPDRRIYAAG